MKEQSFGFDPFASAVGEAAGAPASTNEGPRLALRPLDLAVDEAAGDRGAGGVPGVDFPQLLPRAATAGADAPAAERPAAAARPTFAELANANVPSAAAAPPRPRAGAPTVTIGGGFGALRSSPRTYRLSSMVIATLVAAGGVTAAAYFWLGLGSWPLAVVIGLLGVVGALFSWVMLEG